MLQVRGDPSSGPSTGGAHLEQCPVEVTEMMKVLEHLTQKER